MEVRIWEGYKGTMNGYDDSDFITIVFEGELLGEWNVLYGGYDENRGTSVRVFQTADNTIVVQRVEWSNYEGGEHNSYVYEYKSIGEATADGWKRLFENMNLIERNTSSLKEWRERKKKK